MTLQLGRKRVYSSVYPLQMHIKRDEPPFARCQALARRRANAWASRARAPTSSTPTHARIDTRAATCSSAQPAPLPRSAKTASAPAHKPHTYAR
eukprot:6208873-Pleurochrysis_carterae.AAC.4